ncbi:hypothetical protein SAMN05444411_10885 [Lutibacter oricola]|uniref:Uncharacterized protein n=1 Tax=Lutibacter oricola TaxID=762486 RepID=A0A1H3DXP5_9FLAO|nr:hypothetical protein [Lutibacter oricola]SDX70419.1 hypothetical protein SAMN05444411_10885 [Lutibacter oricola]
MFLQQNALAVVNAIIKEDLYLKLIAQLNKDFYLANIDFSFSEENNVEPFIVKLQEKISNLFYNNYDSYLNLIYRIDVSEKEMLRVNGNSETFITQITLLILKREAQKVWFKSKF